MKMFLALTHGITIEGAREKARKLDVDGQVLYDLKEKEWKDMYDIQGFCIWKHLQGSIYDYVSLSASLFYLACLLISSS